LIIFKLLSIISELKNCTHLTRYLLLSKSMAKVQSVKQLSRLRPSFLLLNSDQLVLAAFLFISSIIGTGMRTLCLWFSPLMVLGISVGAYS
jgi:hypothetical protein